MMASRFLAWIKDSAWALRAIASGLFRTRIPASFALGERAPVLIIPGVFENWTMLRGLCEELNTAGHPIHVISQLGRNTGPIPEAADCVAAYLRTHQLTDVLLLTHSKGGLIGKYLLAHEPELAIEHLITIATPFAGSPYARFARHPVLIGFREDDHLLASLGSNTLNNHQITTITPAFDPYIPTGSDLPGARNIRLPTSGHFRILDDRSLLTLVLAQLSEIAR